MGNFSREYIKAQRQSEKENLKRMKEIGPDPRAQALLVFENYCTSLDILAEFIKTWEYPVEQRDAVFEKIVSLKNDIQELAAYRA